jgi:glutamine amidotransferase
MTPKNSLEVQLIDLQLGNVTSISNALLRSGIRSRLLDANQEPSTQVLLLPGVGHFTAGVRALDKNELRVQINKHLERGGSLIGICLGMQLLGVDSEEGSGEGLSLIGFRNKRIQSQKGSFGPIMGWKTPELVKPNWLSMTGVERYYFMHDYGITDVDDDYTAMTHKVGQGTAVSAVAKGKVIGFQFHPERSLVFGEAILANAVRELSR